MSTDNVTPFKQDTGEKMTSEQFDKECAERKAAADALVTQLLETTKPKKCFIYLELQDGQEVHAMGAADIRTIIGVLNHEATRISLNVVERQSMEAFKLQQAKEAAKKEKN